MFIRFILFFSIFLGLNYSAYSVETKAPYAILLSYDSGKVLYEKSADVQIPPSSMSKLLTLYMLFESLQSTKYSLNTEFTVGDEAWKKARYMNSLSGSTMFLEHGEKIKIEDLIKGIIVNSANDACVVVAENISGSEEKFVKELNQLATRLGLTNTNIVNSSGWYDKDHYMSTRDVAILAKKLIDDFPEYYHYFALKEFLYKPKLTGNKDNRNKLLWIMPISDGLKTGHTNQGGYALVSSAKKNNRRMIAVVNGIKGGDNPHYTRFVETKKLLEYGFREFKDLLYFEKNKEILKIPVWYGSKSELSVGVEQDVIMSVKKNYTPNIDMVVSYKGPIAAPVQKGDIVGELTIYDDKEKVRTYNLISLEYVKKTGVFGRVFKNIKYLILKLVS